jgi:acyl carrier protein
MRAQDLVAKLTKVSQLDKGSQMSTRATILSEIEAVAAQNDKRLAPLSDDIALANTGLDSLCLAILVVRLEDRLGVDPFSTPDRMDLPITLADFVRSYERCLSASSAVSETSQRQGHTLRT